MSRSGYHAAWSLMLWVTVSSIVSPREWAIFSREPHTEDTSFLRLAALDPLLAKKKGVVDLRFLATFEVMTIFT